MPGIIVGGKEVEIPGLTIINYKDNPKLKLIPGEDMRRRRTRWIRILTWHNTRNRETNVIPGVGPSTDWGDAVTRWWSIDGRNAGAHGGFDWNGVGYCFADFLEDAAYHASQLNEVSVGMELKQDNSGRIYQVQLDNSLIFTEWFCSYFGVQRQMPHAGFDGTIKRLVAGGKDCVGIFGHCHVYSGKQQDPGRDIFHTLKKADFMEFDFNKDEDKNFWKEIQHENDQGSVDGIPGPVTCDVLQSMGYKDGLWRPAESNRNARSLVTDG